MSQRHLTLVLGLLLVSSLLSGQARYTYSVSGRVVDSDGKPTPEVHVAFKSTHSSSSDCISVDLTDENGRFTASDSSTEAGDTGILWINPLPKATALSGRDIIFWPKYLGPQFSPQKVSFADGALTKELGDVSATFRYGIVKVKVFDTNNLVIAPDSKTWDSLLMRLRDWKEREALETGFLLMEGQTRSSTLVIPVPEGYWTMEFTLVKQAENWVAIDAGPLAVEAGKPIETAVRLSHLSITEHR